MIATRGWLSAWLAARREPVPLRQSGWCANGLHRTCTGRREPGGVVVDCRCPCHD